MHDAANVPDLIERLRDVINDLLGACPGSDVFAEADRLRDEATTWVEQEHARAMRAKYDTPERRNTA